MAKASYPTMPVLMADLRLLYRSRGLWIIYAFAGVFVWTGLRLVELGGEVATNVLFPVALAAGFAAASVQEAVAFKATSFCLPGRGDSVRSFIFVVGSAISLIGGFFFAACMRGSLSLSPVQAIWALYLSLCFTGIVYLVSVAVTLMLGSGLAMSILLLAVVGEGLLWDSYPAFDLTLLKHPVPVVFVAVLLAAVIWRWLRDSGWFRRRCTQPKASVFFSAIRSSDEEDRRIAASLNLPPLHAAVDARLLALVGACRYRSPAQYILGTLYSTIMPALGAFSRWRVGLPWALLVLIVVVMAGYARSLAPWFMFLILWISARNLDEAAPLFSSLPVNGGRRERCYATVTCVAVLAGLSAMILMLPVVGLNLMAPFLPTVKIAGSRVAFSHISLWLPLLSLIIIPALGVVDFCLHGHQASRVVPCVVGLMVFNLLVFHPLPEVPLGIWALFAAISWCVFVLTIRRIAMHADLVKP